MSIFRDISTKLEAEYLEHKVIRGYFFDFTSTPTPANYKKYNSTYNSLSDIRNTLIAPFSTLLIGAAKAIQLATDTLFNLSMCVLRLVTLDFLAGIDYAVKAVKSVINGLYTVIKGVFDTLVSLFTLAMRTLSSAVACVAGVVDIAQHIFQP